VIPIISNSGAISRGKFSKNLVKTDNNILVMMSPFKAMTIFQFSSPVPNY